MSIESGMPSNHLILCCPLLLLLSVYPSIRVFSNQDLHIRWPKYWGFSFSTNPSNEYPGLMSFSIDWLDPRDSQESSPTPQFKSINSLALSFLHGASLTAQLVKNPPAMQETPVRCLGQEDPLETGGYPLQYSWASLVTQLVKNLPAMQETWVRSLG